MKSLQQIYLGEFQVVKNKQNNSLEMMIKRKTNKQDEMKNQIENLKNRQKISHQNLIHLKKFDEQKVSQLCASFYEVRAFYEYFPNNLKQEILTRRKNKNYFEAIQLLRFLYDAIDVFYYLESQGIKHNELNPLLLFIAEDDQGLMRVKVSERLNGYSNSLANAYDSLNTNLDIYLDPKSFEDLTQGKKHTSSDPFKMDVFSLGVIFLEAGLLQSIQSIYNILGGQFQYKLLEDYFQQLQTNYQQNTLLLSVISRMIEIDENKRPQFRDIKEALPPWNQVYSTSLSYYQPKQNNIEEDKSPKKLIPYKHKNKIFQDQKISKEVEKNFGGKEDDFEHLQTEKSFEQFYMDELKSNLKQDAVEQQNHNLIVSHETQDLKFFGLQDKKRKKSFKKQQLYQFTQSKTINQSQKNISISSNPNYFFKRGSHKTTRIIDQSIQWDDIDFANTDQKNFLNGNFESAQKTSQYESQIDQHQSQLQEDFVKQQKNSQRTIIREELDKDNEEIFQSNNIPRYCKSQNGMIYKSVINEKNEYNDQGQLVRRVYVTYEPVDNENDMSQYNIFQNQNCIKKNDNKKQATNFKKQLDPIKETYSESFNTIEQQQKNQQKELQSSIQMPFQQMQQNFDQNILKVQNRQNQHMYETDFFNVSDDINKSQINPSQDSLQDFFSVTTNTLKNMPIQQTEFPQIDINKFTKQKNAQQKNPYLIQNKVKQNLADMLREYKENEDFYNSQLKANRESIKNQFNQLSNKII